ncbi:hypothetical protein [Arthrobacter alpinus]|uniref:hypothetical protein n=1 Tax=Arthrobacter alpinus TaxID=656366 RepID=UPI003C7271C3
MQPHGRDHISHGANQRRHEPHGWGVGEAEVVHGQACEGDDCQGGAGEGNSRRLEPGNLAVEHQARGIEKHRGQPYPNEPDGHRLAAANEQGSSGHHQQAGNVQGDVDVLGFPPTLPGSQGGRVKGNLRRTLRHDRRGHRARLAAHGLWHDVWRGHGAGHDGPSGEGLALHVLLHWLLQCMRRGKLLLWNLRPSKRRRSDRRGINRR